jgi:hypothetical protein
MPSTDYNIDALIGRIATLEKKLEEGVKVQVERAPIKIKAEENYSAPQTQVKPQTKENKINIESFSQPKDSGEFLNPFEKSVPKAQPQQNKTETNFAKSDDVQPTIFEQPNAATPPKGGTLSESDKGTIFGKFLRCFRTTRKNAVLFTLCMDLESAFEGDKFILITPTEAVYKALTREENSKFIAETLATLGVFSHEVRLKTQGEDKLQSAINKLKDNFKGTDIEIK